VKVGAQAPDFKGTTIDGKSYSLYDSQASHIIVVFWSTDCEYCHDFLTQIRKHLDLKSDFELVTFALAEDKDDVAKTVKKMRLPGYHFYDDLRWDSKAFLDYHITSTPTVFVLDENKTIVCKPYDWLELKDWLRSNNISY
jgi:peroxiredoxin